MSPEGFGNHSVDRLGVGAEKNTFLIGFLLGLLASCKVQMIATWRNQCSCVQPIKYKRSEGKKSEEHTAVSPLNSQVAPGLLSVLSETLGAVWLLDRVIM